MTDIPLPDSSEGESPPQLATLWDRVVPRVVGALERSENQGFLGRMPVSEQVAHALGFVWAVEQRLSGEPRSVLDLGTGGGLPGLVLLSCWPAASVVLLDGNERRTRFLTGETAEWDRPGPVTVVRGRAEDLGKDPEWRERHQLVVARSFGRPAVVAECGSAFVEVDGLLVVSEPPDGEIMPRWPGPDLEELGLSPTPVVRFMDRYGYRVLDKTSTLAPRYPRRTGVPAKRPLF